jgi:tRNA-(ms[2]io[6]A)-hydroxylase
MLAAVTPAAWVNAALQRQDELLLDHANCEKKAASTALALMFAYPEDRALGTRLARLAREELRHFEQVDRVLQQRGVAPQRMAPGRYAGQLRRALRNHEPQRKLDLMLVGALIEARSCERFELLAPQLPAELGTFYADLALSERRHEGLYLQLARTAAADALPQESPEDIEAALQQRLQELAQIEAELITRPDTQFRFHSGPPA